jgi:hypothetical protein
MRTSGEGRDALISQDADSPVVELVNQRSVVGIGAAALLLRPIKVEVGPAREQAEMVREGFAVAADEGVDVIDLLSSDAARAA